MHRAELAARAGVTFGGKRDLNKALGYAEKITPEMYCARYERGGIAAALIKAYPKATWAAGQADIYDSDDPEKETAFETAVKGEFKRLKLWQVLLRLDILAGLGRYGVLLVGRGQALDQKRKKGKAKIVHLQPLGEDRAKITSFVDDLSDERFGLPKAYTVKLSSRTASVNVDPSHCIHFVENPLLDEVYGEPRLQAVWNDLDDLDKLKGGGAEAAWRRAHMGMHANLEPEVAAGMTETELKAQMEQVAEQLDEYDHNMRRFIKTVGVDLNALDGAPFNFDANVRSIVSIIAATMNIPQRKLMGSGIGEMTGKMEDDSFNDAVAERRNTTAEPLLRDLIDDMIETGAVPAPAGGEYKIEWPTEEELDEAQKASVISTITEANAKQKNAGGEPIMTGAELRDRYLDMDPIAPEDLKKIEEKNAPPPPPQLLPPPGTPGAPPSAKGTPAASPSSKPAQPAARPLPRAAAAIDDGLVVQKEIHQIVEDAIPPVEAAFVKAFRKVGESVDLAALEAALASGDAQRAQELLTAAVSQFGDLLDSELPDSLVAELLG